ncbi:HNH endonuclease signature motif containing protein [Brachybacterium sp. NPDC056505]|uniref:HNH endonuclease signature motif containing protein n=1 Tax=Brachybacterium sp. NPDC056505 TaxID=3345843 RepID=UPI00366BA9D5
MTGSTASIASEADHIVEYDHEDPVSGGQTAVENLHFLCWFHHAMKTAGTLDPTRIEADASPTGRGGTVWEIEERVRVFREDDTDLLTPQAVAQLNAVEEAMRRRQEDFQQQAAAADAANAPGSPDPANLDSPWPIRPGPPDPWPRVDMDRAGAPDEEEFPVEKPAGRRWQGRPHLGPVCQCGRPIPVLERKPDRDPEPPPKRDPGPPPF